MTTEQKCGTCRHFRTVNGASMCRGDMPRPILLGYTQSVGIDGAAASERQPIVRGFFPPVGPDDDCGQWTPKVQAVN